MKNLMMILFAMLLITMIGCDNKSSSREYVTGEQSTELPVSTSEQLKEAKTTSNPEHFETSKNEALLSSDPDSSITDNSVIEEKETATASISETDNTHEHQSAPETEKITTEPETSVTSDSDTETTVKSEWTPKVYASAGNAEEISTLVVKYINDYRAEQGVVSITQLPA